MTTESGELRIGVTMRIVEALSYDESRDALAQDWGRFLAAALPSLPWVPVPNLGKDVVTFVQNWGLNGFILTGGDDWGANQIRDLTEETVLAFAEENSFPIFGVCRGLQALQLRFGGAMARCRPGAHVGNRHLVRFLGSAGRTGMDGDEMIVNSFHDNAIALAELADDLEAVAVGEDGLVEAAAHRSYPQLGVMWHPERADPFNPSDIQMIRTLFKIDIFE